MRLKLFAGLRQRAGADEVELELPDGASVAEALEQLEWLTGGMRVVMAINHEYADPSATLNADDELALIPPVSGGSVGAAHARVTNDPISTDALIEAVRDARAGAVVTFMGVTRDVPELEYEAYAAMAEKKLAEIVAAAIELHGLCAAAAEHRVGAVPLSEPSVIVAASAPIWKREEGEWVQGTTPR